MPSFPGLHRYLLGDNPFIGVDHLSQERARERQNRLDTTKILEVIKTAIANGAEGLLFSTHPVMYDVLKQMETRADDPTIGLYPILPYAQSYVRTATEKGVVGLAREVLSRLKWKATAKALASGGISLASMDPERVLRAYVDTELDFLFNNAPSEASLRSVLLHEVLTDLAVSFEAHQLLNSYANHIADKYHVMPGFVTRNFSKFVAFAVKSGMRLDQIIVLAPFNKVGFQMNPSRESCERTLDQHRDAIVIAMSILASGYLEMIDALQYLSERKAIRSFVVGVSTPAHARETFQQMRRTLG